MSGIAKCWHLVSACYIISICACVWIVWVQIKSLSSSWLLWSWSPYWPQCKPQTTHFSAVFSPSCNRRIRWKTWKPCVWIWELETATQTQHPVPEQWHKVPLCPVLPHDRAWPCCPDPLLLGSSSWPVQAQLLPCWRGRKGRAGQGGGAVLWLCGLHGRPFPSSALQAA